MMADNHYGWFVRLEQGVYDLTPDGRAALEPAPLLPLTQRADVDPPPFVWCQSLWAAGKKLLVIGARGCGIAPVEPDTCSICCARPSSGVEHICRPEWG